MDKDISKYLKALDDTVSYDNIDPLQRDNNNIYMIIGKKASRDNRICPFHINGSISDAPV